MNLGQRPTLFVCLPYCPARLAARPAWHDACKIGKAYTLSERTCAQLKVFQVVGNIRVHNMREKIVIARLLITLASVLIASAQIYIGAPVWPGAAV